MNKNELLENGLDAFVKKYIYNNELSVILAHNMETEVLDYTKSLVNKAFIDGDRGSLVEAHRALYRLCLAEFKAPWEVSAINVDEILFCKIRNLIVDAWDEHDRKKYMDKFHTLPSKEEFEGWVLDLVRSHRSNVSHPIFSFLEESASREQLTEFVRQETPFDIHFSDIVARMVQGLPGGMKMEVAQNFWDEMGEGVAAKAHRALRIDMTNRLGIPENEYQDNVETYCLSELEMANLYLTGSSYRSKLTELVGNMLTTESMVPGRLACQINGWKRVGLDTSEIEYLDLHTVVDVEHAEGWMRNVVSPIVESYPGAMRELVFGVVRRLDTAEKVCDELLEYLQG